MEPKIFIARVAAMRTAQKQYFRTRKKEDLQPAKDIEREVDAAIRVYEKREASQQQEIVF